MGRLSISHVSVNELVISLGEQTIRIPRIKLYQGIFWLLFFVFFVSLRAYNLVELPVFVDEATHIGRANRMMDTGPIISPTDIGKMFHPLLLSILFRITFLDQLWVARAFSIFVSLLAAVGCYWLAQTLSNDWRIGVLASLIYSFSPFTFFHDRTALADSLLTCLGIFTLLFSVRLVRSGRYTDAVAVGVLMGLATLTKLYGCLFIFFPIAAWLVLEKKVFFQRLWRVGVVVYLSALVTVSPHFFVVGSLITYMRGKTVKPWEPVSMLEIWQTNLSLISTWLTTYLTPLVIFLALAGFLVVIVRRDRPGIFIGLITLFQILTFIFIARRWFPRYILILTPGFYILAAWAIAAATDWLITRVKSVSSTNKQLVTWLQFATPIILFALFTVQPLLIDYRMLADIRTAPLVQEDRWQFVEGWPAGYGLPEAAAYLSLMAREKGDIAIIRHGITCNIGCASGELVVPEGLQIYLAGEPGVELRTIDFFNEQSVTKLREISARLPTYVVGEVEAPHQAWPDFTAIPDMELVRRFEKPGGNSSVAVYGPSK